MRNIWLIIPHKLNYSLVPDTEFNRRNEEAIVQKVHQRTESLTIDDKNKIVALAEALEKRQERTDDPEILPKVTKEDIPLSRNYPKPDISVVK